MSQPINPTSMIMARSRLERALRKPESPEAQKVKDRLVKYHLTGIYASHLRTESVMLIRAALARSAQDMGEERSIRLSPEVVSGLGLDTHPMAITMATVLVAGGQGTWRSDPVTGRNSFAAIKMEVGGFAVRVTLGGALELDDPHQHSEALRRLQS